MNLKKVFIISAKYPIKGSITAEVNEKGRLTVVMDGLEKGRYDIFMENEKIGQAEANDRGRLIKRIDVPADKITGKVFINISDEYGNDTGSAKISMGESKVILSAKEESGTEPKAETGTINYPEDADAVPADEKLPYELEFNTEPSPIFGEIKEKQRAEYGFSSDFGTIIKRFKEQMERLEKSEVLTAKEIENIENSGNMYKNNDTFMPFKDGDGEWEKVSGDFLWRLPVRDIHFPKSLFFICGQKKYGYIIMKELEDRYRVGAPDTYREKNAPKAAADGFYGFAAESGMLPTEGDMGYWMADILKTD